VGSIPGCLCQQFFNPIFQKKINKALSVRVLVICSDPRLLWQDSYKGVGRASTLPEAMPHKMVIIITLHKDTTKILISGIGHYKTNNNINPEG